MSASQAEASSKIQAKLDVLEGSAKEQAGSTSSDLKEIRDAISALTLTAGNIEMSVTRVIDLEKG